MLAEQHSFILEIGILYIAICLNFMAGEIIVKPGTFYKFAVI